MLTWNEVTAIALKLPKTEVSSWCGSPGVKVAGRGFLRLRAETEGGLVALCHGMKQRELVHLTTEAWRRQGPATLLTAFDQQ